MFNEYLGELLLFSTLIVLSWVYHKSRSKRTMVLWISLEQCLSYSLIFIFSSTPLILKLVLGVLYLFIFYGVTLSIRSIYEKLIAKIYLGVGIYHLLMATEPYVMSVLFSHGVTPYIYLAHFYLNLLANITILALVLFMDFKHGRRIRKRYIFITCIDSGELSSRPYRPPSIEDKKRRGE